MSQLEFQRLSSAEGQTPNEWIGFGIKVNRTTGEVSFDAGPAPIPAPANFIIEAIAKNTASTDQIEPARIRFHVHPAATRMWLTPARLTVRRRTAGGCSRTPPMALRSASSSLTARSVI